jgi:hypothetical protein
MIVASAADVAIGTNNSSSAFDSHIHQLARLPDDGRFVLGYRK